MADDVLIFNSFQWDEYAPRLEGDKDGKPIETRKESSSFPGRGCGRVAYDQVLQEIERHAREISCDAAYIAFSRIKDGWLIFSSSAEARVHYYRIKKEE